MNECIFCKIAQNQINSYKVYEDDDILAFLDIAPNNPGHTLIIPKDHFENIYSVPPETLARMALVTQKISVAIKNSLSADGITISMNNEAAGGQLVFHSHIHVIPRKNGDFEVHYPHKKYDEGEAEEVAKKIADCLE